MKLSRTRAAKDAAGSVTRSELPLPLESFSRLRDYVRSTEWSLRVKLVRAAFAYAASASVVAVHITAAGTKALQCQLRGRYSRAVSLEGPYLGHGAA